MYGHDDKCMAKLAASDKERNEWKARWPGHCPSCEGEGGHEFHNYPSEPDDYDICTCIDNGRCPRCGYQIEPNSDLHELFVEGGEKCPGCGWCVEGGADQACPSPYECWGCVETAD